MPIPPLLDELLRAHGPAGHEHLAFDVVRAALDGVADIQTDSFGNLVAREPGATGPPQLALFAHLDVIGLAVSHINDDGLLSVHRLAGQSAAVAHGQRVEIRTALGSVHGVVARRVRDNEKVEWEQLYVDVGARDGDEARGLVAPGDPMVVVAPPLEVAGGRIVSRNLDDRAGVYVALETMRRLAGEDAGLAVVACAQEELGGDGGNAVAFRLQPEIAIAIDVTYATDSPAGDVTAGGPASLGGGPPIFRGPVINPRVFELLVQAARENGIEHTIETGSRTHTDIDRVFAARGGIAAGLVSIPLRNMHSPIEMVDLGDLEACIRLLVAFARLLEPGLDLRR